MPIEDDPVEDGESLLRRTHRDRVDLTLPNPVQRTAFSPTREDTDGISMFRQLFLENPRELIAIARIPDPAIHVVIQLTAHGIRTCEMDVVPEPTDIPGHSIVPELNSTLPKNERKQREQQLADWVNQNLEIASHLLIYKE